MQVPAGWPQEHRADPRVADVAQVHHLGARLNGGRLDLDEVADSRALADVGAGAQPRERTDDNAGRDGRPLKMAKSADRGALAHDYARPENYVGLDCDIAAKVRIGAQPHRARIDQGHARFQGAGPKAVLHNPLSHCQIGPRVDAKEFGLLTLDGGAWR